MSHSHSTKNISDTSQTSHTKIDAPEAQNFLVSVIEQSLKQQIYANRNVTAEEGLLPEIITRFPPEPNGYLHIGHAKSICLNFGLAKRFNGRCHLRFDDTNPEKESQEYVDSIKDLVNWLGFSWQEIKQDGAQQNHLYYASDYFEQIYTYACALIEHGHAYVDSQNAEAIKKNRGDFNQKGIDSPYRNRTIEENMQLFKDMRAGKYEEGSHVLRAKIDMQSSNLNMRDPVIYRIRYAHHHRTGDAWCVYPMYDFTHCISDAIENISHSICTLEFEDHRPLYDWCLETLQHCGYFKQALPKQYEFARLNLAYALTSKRKILQLVEQKQVDGWDDPRLATLAGIRRRGYTAQSVQLFCERIGVSKAESLVEYNTLEQALRDDLEPIAPRLVCVLNPIELIIENMDDAHVEHCSAPIHPSTPEQKRHFTLSKHLWIERDDVLLEATKGFFRLYPGNKVRLRYGFVVECTRVETNANGEIVKVYVNYFTDSKSGTEGANLYKVKGNIHWVNQQTAKPIEVRLFEHLFTHPQPDKSGQDYLSLINVNSKTTQQAYLEASSSDDLQVYQRFQFERHGYFVVDLDTSKDKPVFNRIVSLKDGKK